MIKRQIKLLALTSGLLLTSIFFISACERSKNVELNFSLADFEKAKAERIVQRDSNVSEANIDHQEQNNNTSGSIHHVDQPETNDQVVANTAPIDSIRTSSGDFRPIIIEAQKMKPDDPSAIKFDNDGGVEMFKASSLSLDDVSIPFTPKSVTIECKGDVANGIPPKFKLVMFNATGNAFNPWGSGDGIAESTEYKRQSKPIWSLPELPLTEGTYKVALYYTNNNENLSADSKQDRNLYIKTIEFHP